jgi:hypothetical protein
MTRQTRSTTTTPCSGRSSGTPLVCQQLEQARAQYLLLASGRGVAVVDTPQLGRVEFQPGNIADLQRLITELEAACLAAQGLDPSLGTSRRRPISVEGCP